ncbi:MAG: hypothetical protein LBM59_07670 [Ruminococcus sp.]|jgi:hypothetical protein|nr:hypothetical protein [Ruminococcus sp.]
MKKDELIAKARERGIEITDEQADKYITLSDEELENLAVTGGGLFCNGPKYKLVPNEKAETCEYFDAANINNKNRLCRLCMKSVFDEETKELFCQNQAAW